MEAHVSLARSRLLSTSLILICLISVSRGLFSEVRPVFSGLTVHEWGTFTSIAGSDGQAVVWWPLTGGADLPGFVEHFRDARFKFNLEGTVRMETPVIYFYSSREQNVSVSVRFTKGVITEWYPHASRVQPVETLNDWSLSDAAHADGSIAWDALTLAPDPGSEEFLSDETASHYYAARQTTSTPLIVRTATGEQREKFLFYRGVSMLQPPVAATVFSDASPENARSTIHVENLANEPVPTSILFERRGDRLSFRIYDGFSGQATFQSPESTGSLDQLCGDLEQILISQGLFANEAHAMVETWRDSWFEEGSRLLYIVPQEFVNSVLPLTINPAPAQIVRVFVGRMELVTPATQVAVSRAITSHDKATLARYGRFLEPILQTMLKTSPAQYGALKLQDSLDAERAAQWYLNPAKKK